MLYSCKDLFNRIKKELKEEIAGFTDAPRVCVVTSGDDEPSQRYVRNKLRDFKELGIEGEEVRVENSMQLMYFLANNARKYDGVIVQRPIDVLGGSPKEMAQRVASCIPPEVDIDGVSIASDFTPPSVRGLDLLLHEWDYDPAMSVALVIGRGDVGRPVADYLLSRNATVMIAHSKTPMSDRNVLLAHADIVVGAAGLDEPITPLAYMHDIVIDYGITNGKDGKLHGDFTTSRAKYVDYQTAVPGGMGLMVRAGLLLNIVDAYKRKHNM